METGTRFDLSAAVQGWREQLAAQPAIAPDQQRELHTHLQDTIADLQGRGLPDEESFWLACRRMGQPANIAQEFGKADTSEVWRERVLWLVLGICTMHLWYGVPVYALELIRSGLTRLLANNLFLPDWVLFYLPFRTQWLVENVLRSPIFTSLFWYAPLILLLAVVARGRAQRVISALSVLFKSRRRFLAVAAASLGVYYTLAIYEALQYAAHWTAGAPSVEIFIRRGIASAVVSVILAGLVAWLLPSGKSAVEDPCS